MQAHTPCMHVMCMSMSMEGVIKQSTAATEQCMYVEAGPQLYLQNLLD